MANKNGMTHKIWISSGGSSSRRSHKQLDGMEIGLNEYFKVNGSRLFLPSDPNVSVGEIANCQCSIKFVNRSVNNDGSENADPRPLSGLLSDVSLGQLIEHYLTGDGSKVYVKFERVDIFKPLMAISECRDTVNKIIAPYRMKVGVKPIEFKFSYDHHDFVFGHLTYRVVGTFESFEDKWVIKGRLAVYDDTWDFDSKVDERDDSKVDERDIEKEILVRGWNLATAWVGTNFDVRFVDDRSVELEGTW